MAKRAQSDRILTADRNRMLLLLVLIAVVAIIVYKTCASHKQSPESNRYRKGPAPSELQIPAVGANEEIIRHTAYTLSFNPSFEQATWVAYVLRGASENTPHFSRTNHFMTDPEVTPHSADDADYEGSGYDRGHLAPAEDMSWSATAMKESFFYSNMSPQVPAFNRGVWKRLEELVRFWATAYDSLYVVTGPVLTKGLPTIGHDQVAVPKYYYKVILEYNPKGTRAIGFVLPNDASLATLRTFAVPVDSVEHMTGIDFFPRLPDDVEEALESKATISDWRWTRGEDR